MSEKAGKLDPLPDEFASYEEAAEFWDSHDTTDYPEAFADEPIELHADFKSRRYEVEIAEDLMLILRQRARESRPPDLPLVLSVRLIRLGGDFRWPGSRESHAW